MMGIIRETIRRVAFVACPEHRAAILQRVALVTQETLRVRLDHLGDFGGTQPIQDSWVLEVAGATFEYRDTLKKLGLSWNPGTKVWRLDATLYKFNNAKMEAEWDRDRKRQKAALPVLQQLAKEHNTRVDQENRSHLPAHGTREFTELMQRHLRMKDRLAEAGLAINFKSPGQYDSGEMKVFVSGNTYAHLALMKKYGFKWDGSKKAWWLPAREYTAVGDKWMGEVIRDLPKKPVVPPAKAVFSEMSPQELTKFLVPIVDADMEAHEFYDGEVSHAEVMLSHKRSVLQMNAAEQTAYYKKVTGRDP